MPPLSVWVMAANFMSKAALQTALLVALHPTGRPCRICATGGGDLRVSFTVSLSVPHFAVIRYFISRYVCRLLCRFVCRALAATADAYHFPDAGKMLTACHTAPNQALAD